MGVSPDDFNLLVGLLCYDMPVYARELTLPLAERRLSVFLSFNDFAAGVNVCLAVREFLYRAEQLFLSVVLHAQHSEALPGTPLDGVASAEALVATLRAQQWGIAESPPLPSQLSSAQAETLRADVAAPHAATLGGAERALRALDGGSAVTLHGFMRVAVEHLSPLRAFVGAAKTAGTLRPASTTRGAAELIAAFRSELGE